MYGNGGTVTGQASSFSVNQLGNAAPTPIGVHDTVNEQQSALAELHKTISELENRLGSILRMEPGNATDKPMPPDSGQLLHRVQQNNIGIRIAVARITSILSRIEL